MIVRSTRAAARGASRAGFTLMEVLVVVMILVVLAGTGGVIYMNYLTGAKEDIAKTKAQALSQAAEIYKMHYGEYPPTLAALTQPTPDGKLPSLEPSALLDPWGKEFIYVNPGSHHPGTQKPDIYSQGENGIGAFGNW